MANTSTKTKKEAEATDETQAAVIKLGKRFSLLRDDVTQLKQELIKLQRAFLETKR